MTFFPSSQIAIDERPVALRRGGAVTLRHHRSLAASAPARLVLAHGAGAGQDHPFMRRVADGLAAAGLEVVTFDFPYMHAGRRLPDPRPVLEDCFLDVLDASRTPDTTLLAGGKSMGGRIATFVAASGIAAGSALAGLVLLGYPLHPPGRPDRPRTAHLPSLTVPLLVVQGARDAFGTPEELQPVLDSLQAPATLCTVRNGDHSFALPRHAAPDPGAVFAALVGVVVTWALGTTADRHTRRTLEIG